MFKALKNIKEILETLRSIDESLKELRKCVRPGINHRPGTPHIVVANWND